MPWPQTPAGITRPCCGAHVEGFDRATAAVRLPHQPNCHLYRPRKTS